MSAHTFHSFLLPCALSRSLTCPAGQYLNNAACAPCPSGTFTAAPSSASSCTPCAAGLYASAASGSTSCTACAAGLFSAAIGAADASSCVTCAARYATGASAGATACTLCASGQWAAAASTACSSCAAGTSAATPGTADVFGLAPRLVSWAFFWPCLASQLFSSRHSFCYRRYILSFLFCVRARRSRHQRVRSVSARRREQFDWRRQLHAVRRQHVQRHFGRDRVHAVRRRQHGAGRCLVLHQV